MTPETATKRIINLHEQTMQVPSLTSSFFIHFPYEPAFPRINTDACLHHTYILAAFFDDPAFWYFLRGRREFWDKTALARKPQAFYKLYFGLVIGFLNLWARGAVNVHKKDSSILISLKDPVTNARIGFFEDALLQHCRTHSPLPFRDLLTFFFADYKNVKQFSERFSNIMLQDYGSLSDMLAILRWFLEIHEKEIESEDVKDPLAWKVDPIFVAVQLMDETEAFVLRQKWRW